MSTTVRTASKYDQKNEVSNTWRTHTPIHIWCHWRRRWLISKSSFSRQCVGGTHDTCSQLTWKSHSPHTHGGTFWPTLTPAQTLYLHESCQISPNLKFVNRQRRHLTSVHRSYSWYTQPVWHETYILTHTWREGQGSHTFLVNIFYDFPF